MKAVFVIAGFGAAVALMVWNAGILRRFKRDYRYSGKFPGNPYECVLRFANLEDGIWCVMGADASALYILPASGKRSREMWSKRGTSQKTFGADLRIPWTDLEWQEKTILFKDCIWFEIPAKQIYFYVPKDIGDKLLVDAQRKLQSEFDFNGQSQSMTTS